MRVSAAETVVSDDTADSEGSLFMPNVDDNEAVSGLSGGFEEGDNNSVVCIHELDPAACKVCSGYVRRLIESEGTS